MIHSTVQIATKKLEDRERLKSVLARSNLNYCRGGKIVGALSLH